MEEVLVRFKALGRRELLVVLLGMVNRLMDTVMPASLGALSKAMTILRPASAGGALLRGRVMDDVVMAAQKVTLHSCGDHPTLAAAALMESAGLVALAPDPMTTKLALQGLAWAAGSYPPVMEELQRQLDAVALLGRLEGVGA